MSHRGALTALGLAGMLALAACSPGQPAANAGPRVADLVRVGPYTQQFASPLPASAAQAAVIEGFREGQVLWEKSENAGHLVAPVRDYVAGHALTHLTSAMKVDKSQDVVPAGTDRFFQTQVTKLASHAATITTCDDGSKFKQVNPRTGKVATNFLPTPGEQYLFEKWQLGLLDGRWAITGFTLDPLPSRTAEHCQPGMSGSGPSHWPAAATLVRQMNAALRSARSVHIAGRVDQGGSVSSVNLSITSSGRLFGQVSEGGQTFTVLELPGHFYLMITAAFLRVARLPASACHRFCGKYLSYPAAQSRQLAGDLSLASLTHSLTGSASATDRLLGAEMVDGHLAWLLQDSQENSIYVAATGQPYVLSGVSAPPADDTVTLTQWNAVHIPGPPPPGHVVTAAQLAQ